MTRDLKHVIVYGAFGLLLGAKIVEVLLTRTDTSLLDWWLLLIGVVAAIVHYLPTKEATDKPEVTATTDSKPQPKDAPAEPPLVLRDPADLERGPTAAGHPAASTAGREDERDGFV